MEANREDRRMRANGQFESMSEAFSFCRECDRPVIVQVNGRVYHLFPSGKAVDLSACAKTQYEQRMLTNSDADYRDYVIILKD